MKLPAYLIVLLVIATLATCADSEEQAIAPAVEPTVIAANPMDAIPSPTPISKAVTAFPTHNEPLPTDWGYRHPSLGPHIMVELAIENSCPRALGYEGGNNEPIPSYLLVWPDGFKWREKEDAIHISDQMGIVVARVGDMVRFFGRLIDSDSDLAREVEDRTPESCVGPYYIVGDEVSVIGQHEPDTLSVPGYTLYFQRLKTRILTPDMVDSLKPFSDPMKLELNGDCLIISNAAEPSNKHMVVWPQGFYPRIGEDGELEVHNGGRRLLTVGAST